LTGGGRERGGEILMETKKKEIEIERRVATGKGRTDP